MFCFCFIYNAEGFFLSISDFCLYQLLFPNKMSLI